MKSKHVTTYICDVCGAEFTRESECMAHEAACYGLTTNEYGIWEVLHSRFIHAVHRFDTCHNNDGQDKMEAACENLLEFEARHRLTTQEMPSDWRR